MFDSGGKLIGVLGIARDITEQKQAAEKLRLAVMRELASHVPPVTISVGVASAAGLSMDIPSLLEGADAALYKAKHAGRHQVAFFEEELENDLRERSWMETELRKAVRDGSPFDVWTSGVIIVGYAVPAFLFAVLLIVLFAGGSYFKWFPLRGLVSDDWSTLGLVDKVSQDRPHGLDLAHQAHTLASHQ